jgi:flagellar hook-associated protein 2
MAPTSSVSGLSSGIDWRSMIEQIRTAEHKPIDLVSKQKGVYENKLKAWQELNTKLLALKTAAEKLNKAQGFNLFTSTSRSSTATNPDDLLTATVGEAGQVGSYAIQVLQTARVGKWSSSSFTSQAAALGTSYAGSFTVNGRTVTVAADDTLADVRTKINNLNSGDQATKATASIVSYSATDNRLILTSQTEGAAGITLAPVLEPEGAPNLVTALGFTEIQTGLDASLMVDGVSVTRSSNTISDLLPGITLNLKKAEPGTTVTLNVNRDLEGVTGLIKDFVDQYNQVLDFIRTQSTYNQTNKQTGGVLFGDGTLRSVKKDLVNIVINPVWGAPSAFSILGQAGIKLNNQGDLSVDETTLKGYLGTNFDDIKKLFIAEGTSSSSSLDYVSHRLETKPGTYTVNISRAPASGVDIAGTINGEAAVGNGDTLTGAQGTSAEGLVVSYSGSTTGDVGSVTLTAGVAEAFSRILYNLTDSLGGYVADKQTSIQSRIDNLGKKINVMEDRLDKRMEVLTSQYVAMETSMSKMQSLSSWLSSQISQLSK